MKTKEFIAVHLADVHWGALDPKEMFRQLKTTFIPYLQKNKSKIDMLVFAGDYWDTKIPLTEQTSIIAIKFFNQICQFCDKNNIAIRVIKGTKTHDFNQLDNFKYLEKQYTGLKIINTVTDEVFNDEISILYVPEEYMNDQDSYYEEYKKNEYDLMFGHGTWDVFAFDNQIVESERPIKGSPVFKYKEWENVIKSKIVFGHIHIHNTHKKLEYPGSFTRWIFGEEKPKGFLVTKTNIDTEVTKTEFIENTEAQVFETFNLSEITDAFKDDIETIIEKISTLTEDKTKRVKIKIDTNVELENLNILKESYSNTSVKFEMKSVRDKVDEGESEEHDFTQYDLPTNLSLFIKEKYGEELSVEEINEILAEEDFDADSEEE